MNVVKRDGKLQKFDIAKIVVAITKACKDIKQNPELVINNTMEIIQDKFRDLMGVEEIQDLVLEGLYNVDKEVANRYSEYRSKRNRIRRNAFYKMIDEMVKGTNEEVAKENGNMNADAPSGIMSKIGFESAKEFAIDSLLLEETKNAMFVKNTVYINDLDYYLTKALVCIQTNVNKLFSFDEVRCGDGAFRKPRRIGSASQLVGISLQTSQNLMAGGQSIHALDFGLAPFVRESLDSYIKELGEEDGLTEDEIVALATRYIDDYKYDTIPKDRVERVFVRAIKYTIRDTYQAMKGLVHDLSLMKSRGGCQVVFSSLNYGTDTSAEGRLVTKALLEETIRGIGKGRTPIFPIHVFKVKTGINRLPEDRNHDLFKLALECHAKRYFPNFMNLDAEYNQHEKWNINDPERYIYEPSTMGCRTRVFENRLGEKTSLGRGNASFGTVNLPGLAIESKDLNDFMTKLKDSMEILVKELVHRYEWQMSARVKQVSYLTKYLTNVNEVDDEMEVRECFKDFSLSMGFIGLAECLKKLTGKHHGESEESYELGINIVDFMNNLCKEFAQRYNLNIGLFATPAEGLSGKFTMKDREKYGVIEGVTDREFYTNSFHIPVYHNISMREKIEKEATFHSKCPAGHISYIELDGVPADNIKALERLVNYAFDKGIGYLSFNYFQNTCNDCEHEWVERHPKKCPKCGSKRISSIQRITGYLTSTTDKWNKGKQAELLSRVAHN